MTILPAATDDFYSIAQGVNAPTTLSGNLGTNDVRSDDSTAFGWAGPGFNPAGSESSWAFFSGGVLAFLEIVGTVSYPHPVISTATVVITSAGGRVILDTSGNFTYTAPEGFTGTDSFEYSFIDEQFEFDIGRVEILVSPAEGANRAPVAGDDTFDVRAGARFVSTVSVLANDHDTLDSDASDDDLSVTPQTFLTTEGGVVSLYADGNFAYTPPAGFTGVDTFDYTVKDGRGAKGIGTVTLNVGAINSAPVAKDDAFSIVHDLTLTGNVLADNGSGADHDPDGDALAAVPSTITTANGGVVTINADGTFIYTAANGFVGSDSFEYSVSDGRGESDTGLVSITVTNAGPTAYNDYFTANFGYAVSGNVLANNGSGADFDSDGDAISISSGTFATVQGGKLVLRADGSFDYVPKSGFHGIDTFAYQVTDSLGATGHATLQIKVEAPKGTIAGSAGNDTITGTLGDDYIFAGKGKDTVNADSGNDVVYGDDGKDTLNGGLGDDTLVGGANGDSYTGGSGADRFVLSTCTATDYDRITDFKSEDTLVFSGDEFGLAKGALKDASYLVKAGASAVDHGRFVYDQGNKSLFWDADGNAATTDVLVTTFSNKVSLTLADFEFA